MRLLLLTLLCSLTLGCKSLEGLGVKNPTAVVHNMDVRDITADGFTMDFDIEVDNPNAFALPLTNTDYQVAVAGVDAVNGNISPAGSIPANGSGRVTLPINVTYQQLLDLGNALADSGGEVPYRFNADLGADAESLGGLMSNLKIPLEYEGTLDLASLLRDPDALTSPAARELARKALGRLLGF
ncbi:LEA type 2 family protein [Phycisphaeraceae bacterium D3-23]